MSKIASDIGCLNCCHENQNSISCNCQCHRQTRVLATNQLDSTVMERVSND